MSIESALISHNKNVYKEYIANHKNNVIKAWELMKNNSEFLNLLNKNIPHYESAISAIDVNIENHDMSKYGKEEFDAYRKEFYPVSPEEKENNKAAFDLAWKHHYHNNMHHWNWWYESGNKDNMPIIYLVEMICDWEAMGYQFGNNSKEYYEANKHKIHLGDKQREFIEELMNIICK